jgi:methylmalonyl-CoA mutase C-terminal domain/subunit
MTLFAKLMSLLEANEARDIVVFGGGIIPVDDIAELRNLGVAQIFTPGATTQEITAWVAENVPDASSH